MKSSLAARADVELFIKKVLDAGYVRPEAFSDKSGDIFVSWRSKRGALVASFDGDGYYGYAMLRDGHYKPAKQDGVVARTTLPKELTDYLDYLYDNLRK